MNVYREHFRFPLLMILCVISAYLVPPLLAFNISPLASIIRDPHTDNESYFGYAVALQKTPARLIVGAPRANSMRNMNLQRPGVAYVCSTTRSDSTYSCSPLHLHEITGSHQENIREIKSNSWIGGSIDVSDSSSDFTVCGPLWRNDYTSGTTSYYLVNGVCFISNRDNVQKLVPLGDLRKQGDGPDNVFYYAYGEAGLSVHFTPSRELIIGAPGVLMWTGTVIKYAQDGLENPIIPNPRHSISLGLEDYGYTGYAVTSGQFTRNQRLYVTSAPRSSFCRGQVFLFEFPNDNNSSFSLLAKLRGTQMGEYFGATLSSVDVDGDGLDDLMVGSPLFSTGSAGDMGAVYVYLNSQIWADSVPPLQLFGDGVSGARFGSAIGALADLDQDGFKDVAIGAPYEGSGVVYIYRGSKSGLSKMYAQKITASSLDPFLLGFGISISRAVDVDGNRYPDIAVGAHESGHVTILKSRPVVVVNTRLKRDLSRAERDGVMVFELCLRYGGNAVPATLDVMTELVVDESYRRAKIRGTNKVIFTLRADVVTCKFHFVELTTNDTWGPNGQYAVMPISVNSSLVVDSMGPIPTPESNLTDHLKVQIIPTCKKEECIPLWQLGAHFPNITGPNGSFVLGSSNTVAIQVQINNAGDEAFLKMLVITLSDHVKLKTIPAYCSHITHIASYNYSCLSAARFPTNQPSILDLVLDVSEVIDRKSIDVNISALSFDTPDGVNVTASLNLVRIHGLAVSSRASPEAAVVPTAANRQVQVTSITHMYETYGTGYTVVSRARLIVTFPYYAYIHGEWQSVINDFSIKASLGDDAVNCTTDTDVPEQRLRRDSTSLTCGNSDTVKCVTAICEAGPLFPRLHSLFVSIRMDLDLTVADALVDENETVFVNTSARAEVIGESDSIGITGGAGTLLHGPKPAKEDPQLPLYIAIGVVVAVVLLALLSSALWKCGFFTRWKRPKVEEMQLKDGEGDPTHEE